MKRFSYFRIAQLCFVLAFLTLEFSAEAQNRLYMRFSDNADSYPFADAHGLRIRWDNNSNFYWLLGYSDDGAGRHDALATVTPLPGLTEIHAHYNVGAANSWTYSHDFTVNGNNDAAMTGFVKPPSPNPVDLSVVTVAATLTPSSFKQMFSMTNRFNYGKAIFFTGTDYIVAFDSQDLGTGGKVETGVCSINAGTWAVNWWLVLPPTTYVGNREEVTGITQNPISGNYAICGNLYNNNGSVVIGMVTEVSAAGALLDQKFFTPNSGYNIWFNGISCVTSMTGQEFIISGTYQHNGTQKAMFVASILPFSRGGLSMTWMYYFNIAGNSGDHAEGYRHTSDTWDGSIVVAGKRTHLSSGYTSGLLLKIKNHTYTGSDCGSNILDKLMQYDTYDPIHSQMSSTELVDVVKKIAGNYGNELSAVGTALVNHQYDDGDLFSNPPRPPASALLSDVLWLDTDVNMNSNDGNSGTNDCQDSDVQPDCGSETCNLSDEPKDELTSYSQWYQTLYVNQDYPDRLCGELDENTRAKAVELSEPIIPFTAENTLRVEPCPGTGTSQNVFFSLATTQNVTLRMFTMNGNCVLTTDCGLLRAGMHTKNIDISALTSGVYQVVLQSEVGVRVLALPIIH